MTAPGGAQAPPAAGGRISVSPQTAARGSMLTVTVIAPGATTPPLVTLETTPAATAARATPVASGYLAHLSVPAGARGGFDRVVARYTVGGVERLAVTQVKIFTP